MRRLIYFILFLIIIFFIVPVDLSYEGTLKHILPDEYDFKIVSCEESNMLYFEGIDREGNPVHESIQYFWDISKYYSIGDSIIKKKGDKNIKLVKPDTVIILRLGGQDGPLYEEEKDSLFRLLMNRNKENAQ